VRRAPRHWAKFEYFDPYLVLPKLQALRVRVGESDLPDKTKALRTRNLQEEREYWDAVVLCYLLSEASGLKIFMCREQDSDFDTIFTWKTGDAQAFAPVQMKELVSEELNPKASLESIFDGLKKYSRSDDLVVGIKLNRNTRIDFDSLAVPDLPVAEVWLFGATSPYEGSWTLFGEKDGTWHRWDVKMPDA